MRKLIVTEFASLDGVMEAPGGEPGYRHAGWVINHPQDADQGAYKLRETMEADAMLLGRVTYEGFAAAWPERDGEFADKMNAMPKHVASTTLSDPLEWENSQLLSGDVPAAVAALKKEPGGDILVHGSRTLVHALLEHGLIDEIRVMTFPLVLGSGRRLFPSDLQDTVPLELADTQVFGSGVVLHAYTPGPGRLSTD
ncbi:MAG: dihydrofolate reductase family protein [Solirubrobacterales bacterium]